MEHENDLCKHVDQIWCVNNVDAHFFQSQYGATKVKHIFPPIDLAECRQVRREYIERCATVTKCKSIKLGIIGDYFHIPNYLSLKYIIDHICPLLERVCFQGEINIVGKGLTDKMRVECKRFNFIKIHGFIKSIRNFWLDNDLLLLPHVEATGVRMKMLEAIGYGMPILTQRQALIGYPEDIQQSSGLVLLASDKEWVDNIMFTDHRERRKKFVVEEIPRSLNSSDQIYSAIDQVIAL